ncbi:hypothetical protein MLD38_037532 [Melastoma candidum]|uniref:Uncharacterized protein n=1 Tax=Melastoma candidum TaxID=119954 RepID=A0ACB9LNK7_9MYRT|nr:hypothetical protein MLD38_037532 [Melastoma candidum]
MEQSRPPKDISQFKGLTRLPGYAVPRRYDLCLKLDLVACTFSGTVDVDLEVVEQTEFLVLNALELEVHRVCFVSSDEKKISPSEVVLDAEDEILILGFDEKIDSPGGVLKIEFSGDLNSQLKGLYKCTYTDGEEKKNMAATQFEAVDARRCFPCWDEPALKASFKITLDVPSELTALSNMPVLEEKVGQTRKTVHFEESPLMSTYLVAVVVGLFDFIEDTTADGLKVRVYCPPGKSGQGKFSLEIAVKAIDLYTEYFSTPYPLPKLDLVAVPEFAGGAMENYGLIIYRENELFYDDLQSTSSRKQRITIVGMHEVAHMWFGNLVTMEWWTHLWLNEGFATWVSYMATDKFFPEWRVWTQFLDQCASGLSTDALESSHPIEVEVRHARSVLEIFDAISYEKGSAVIHMLQGYLGDAAFQKSLSAYMKRYAWKNAKTEDLWTVFTEELGIEVKTLMNTWTKQKGYPVILVKLKGLLLEFEQSRFLSSGKHGEGQWIVPITLCLGSHSNQKKFLLESKLGKIDMSDQLQLSTADSDEQLWIKVNVDQTGFYRVRYEQKLVSRLVRAIEQNLLSTSDKFGILDDTHALCMACQESISTLLALVDVLREEVDYIILSKLIDVCRSLVKIFYDALPDSVEDLKEYFKSILRYSAARLAWDSISGESHLNVLLRGEVLKALATFDDEGTHEEAIRRFEALLRDPSANTLSADTKRAAYISLMRKTTGGSRTCFDALLTMYRETDTVQEKERILQHVASSSDPDIMLEVLNFLVSDEVRDQDITYGLGGISLEGREVAWKWLTGNWDFIVKKYGTGVLFSHFIIDIISPFSSNEKANEIEAFFTTRLDPSFAMNLEQSLEKVRVKARWFESIRHEESLPHLVKQLLEGRSQ